MKILKLFLSVFVVLLFSGTNVLASDQQAGSSAILVAIPKNEIANRISHRDIAQDYMLKRRVITKVLQENNSPLVDSVDSFISTCANYQIDCYLLPSITRLESSFGQFTHPNSHNPFGWGGGYIMFNTWGDSIDAVGKGLRTNYIDKGAADVYDIGKIYAASPTWAVRVERFMNDFKRVESEESLQASNISL
ncbi:MAG: hypothetical protein WAT44_03160 [Microgenomates group bacterium]